MELGLGLGLGLGPGLGSCMRTAHVNAPSDSFTCDHLNQLLLVADVTVDDRQLCAFALELIRGALQEGCVLLLLGTLGGLWLGLGIG